MRVAIYLRISQDRDGNELGVTRQQEDCLALAALRGWTVLAGDIFIDNDMSARSGKRRPAYVELMRGVANGDIDRVIVYASARLWRNPRERLDGRELFQRTKTSLVPVKGPELDFSSAVGRMLAGILGEMDTAEVDINAERSQREAIQRAEQGRNHGGPKAFGVTADGLELVEEEADEIRRWYALILAGGSIFSIRKQTGRNHASILAILRNPRNAGLRILNNITYRSSNPSIVDEATWRAVNAILSGRERPGHKTARKHLGVGTYVCDECDRPVKGSYGGSPVYRTYACMKLHGGCGKAWQAERIDAFVEQIVVLRMGEDDFADLLVVEGRDDVRKLSTEAAGIRRRLEQLGTEFADDDEADIAEFRTARTRLRARLADVDERLIQAGDVGALGSLAGVADPGTKWLEMNDVRRRAAILDALYSVRLKPSPRGRPSRDANVIERIVEMSPR